MNKLNILLIIFFIFLIHFFDGFKNIYKISKRDYESRMQLSHGYCEKESYGFYNEMVKKHQINKYKVIQQNYEGYPLFRGFFYEKDLMQDKVFVLILNYPSTTIPNSIQVEGVNVNLSELSLLERKKNCYLYVFNS